MALKIEAQMAIEAEKQASNKLLEQSQGLDQTTLGKRSWAGRPKLSDQSLRAEHTLNLAFSFVPSVSLLLKVGKLINSLSSLCYSQC
jgi:hypothetical protein